MFLFSFFTQDEVFVSSIHVEMVVLAVKEMKDLFVIVQRDSVVPHVQVSNITNRYKFLLSLTYSLEMNKHVILNIIVEFTYPRYP